MICLRLKDSFQKESKEDWECVYMQAQNVICLLHAQMHGACSIICRCNLTGSFARVSYSSRLRPLEQFMPRSLAAPAVLEGSNVNVPV